MLSIVAALAMTAFPETTGSVRLLETDTRPHIRLVSDEDNRDLDQMTREQLWRERDRVNDDVPSLIGPGVLGGIGVGVFLVGLLDTIAWATATGLDYAAALTVFWAVVTVIGAGMVVIGVVWFLSRLHARDAREVRLRAIDARLPALDPNGPPPPPPPPPGAQAMLETQLMAPVFTF